MSRGDTVDTTLGNTALVGTTASVQLYYSSKAAVTTTMQLLISYVPTRYDTRSDTMGVTWYADPC